MVTDLVARVGNGEKQAWDALVERYSPLIWWICRRRRLGDADARAVGQSIWRQLASQLDDVRDPGALARLAGGRRLAGMRKCAPRGGGVQIAGEIAVAGRQSGRQVRTAEQERLMADRHATMREAFSRLSPCCQRLLTLLMDEPLLPDAEISARLDIPAGGVGPTRSRCLEKLRRDPPIAALTSAGTVPRLMPGRARGDDYRHGASCGPARDVAHL